MNLRSFSAGIILFSTLFVTPAHAGPNGNELFQAVQFQDVESVRALIAKGADVNHVENGRPLLGWAAQDPSSEIVDLLLKAGAKPNVADDGVGQTPLMRAIETQQPGAVLLLLKAKADPNAKTPDGKTCLTMAVESRKPKVVQALIVAGANVKYVTPDGDSPTLTAAQDGMDESLAIIAILGKAGAEMNASNAAYTPLIYAISQSNAKLVKTLLDAGADPNAPTKSGQTPISSASNDIEMLKLLLAAKANPNVKDGNGQSPLGEAIYNDQIEVVKLLLAAGADVQKAGPDGKSALEYAQANYRTEIIALLTPSSAEDTAKVNPDTGGAEPASSVKCTLVDAARMQMLLHGSLQEQVDAGKMDSNIFRTFGDDTKDYARMLAENPSEACGLFERLAKKYGVESPLAKLNAAK